jgi:hypothetical protein
VDGSLLTSWVVGKMAGRLQLQLAEATRVSKLHVIGGCVESRASYESHARVRSIKVGLGPGHSAEGSLQDGDPYFQTVELPPTKTSQLVIEVAEVYPGRRAGSPACIAELRFE